MKFAKSLHRNQVPEWTKSYIDYKGLKKLVKQVSYEAYGNNEPDPSGNNRKAIQDSVTAPFFYNVDRNTEMVDQFFNKKFAEYCRRLSHVEERFHEHQHFRDRQQQLNSRSYPNSSQIASDCPVDAEEENARIEEIISVILEIRGNLRKLQWYAEVNKRGFAKILKKFDKKVGTEAQTRYLTSRILILPFANGQAITDRINVTNRLLQQLAPAQFGTDELLAGLTLHPTSSATSVSSNGRSSPQAQATSDGDGFRQILDSDDELSLKSYDYSHFSPRLLVNLLVRAIAVHADKCIPVLVDLLSRSGNELLEDASDINHRNVVHRVIIAEGRRVLATIDQKHSAEQQQSVGATPKETLRIDLIPGTHIGQDLYGPDSDRTARPGNVDIATSLSLKVLIDCLSPSTRLEVLGALDQQLRTPLHHAARHGLSCITKLLLEYGDSKWAQEPDADGQTPIELAISHSQPITLRRLLEACPDGSVANELILVPARLNYEGVLAALLDHGCDIDYQEPASGDSALHVASKYNHCDCVRLLLDHGANIELKEFTFGWTPLFVAAVDGSQSIVKLLLQAGALKDTVDNSGWTAKEHAALRGHIELSRLFPPSPVIIPNGPATPTSNLGNNSSRSTPATASLEQRRSNDESAIKTFGHRYLENPEETLILVTLGSRDVRLRSTPPVQLDNVPVSEAGQTQLDTALSLMVSATNCTGEPFIVDLPVHELGLATEPIAFHSKHPEKVQILFDLVPTYSTKRQILGRGVAYGPTVSDTKNRKHLKTLDVTQKIPLLEASSLRVLGTITFETLAVRPLVHPANGIGHSSTYWKSLITTRVIGHRGLGKNTLSRNSLQLGENTVESFIQAANLGASYVEFDVQLTKDLVPVIYHDFVVGDSGFDIPMHSMTLDQLLNIHRPIRGRSEEREVDPVDEERTQLPTVPEADENGGDRLRPIALPKRSMSLSSFGEDNSYDDAVRRMKHTRDFKAKGFKGNVRGMHIQSQFATLEQLFLTLPQGLGFNIECKYAMLDEAEAEEMEENAIDINVWVDTVLKVIFDHKKDRDIILSSFNPDVCILLSLKQPSLPVLFLTESGTTAMMDIRSSSLQEAVRFARRWNLLGLVSEATPLIDCPRLVGAVKDSGLVCFTYGADNNIPEFARRQLKAGVDAVIVDSVLAIRRELTDEADSDSSSHTSLSSGDSDILAKEVNSAIAEAETNKAQRQLSGSISPSEIVQ